MTLPGSEIALALKSPMGTVAWMLVLAVCLQLADHLYHRRRLTLDTDSSEPLSLNELRIRFRGLGSRRLDNFLAILPFAWTYLLIVASAITFHAVDSFIVRAALVLFVAGRFRTLQEIGHFAVHGSLCPNKKWGRFLANVLYQFPAFMPEAGKRRVIHVLRHHRSVNMAHDPDLQELVDIGLEPGISAGEFWLKVFHPLTFAGIADRLRACVEVFRQDRGSGHVYQRALVVLLIVALASYFGYYTELLFLYVLPVLVVYPAFYWLAHLTLHRWFAQSPATGDYFERELELGRATEFPGLTGFIVRHNILPLGDSYHLAHSLFPGIRWNYLPQVDAILKKVLPGYGKYTTHNLLITGAKGPSAIGDLRDHLVARASVGSVPR